MAAGERNDKFKTLIIIIIRADWCTAVLGGISELVYYSDAEHRNSPKTPFVILFCHGTNYVFSAKLV